jgi:hypothetical protein
VIAVRIPRLTVTVINLHESHAALDEPPSQQASVGIM